MNSDLKWIRRMAVERRMIEPFEPGQVKEAKGQRIVSYGTSSYGYDIRCSNEFRSEVDPPNGGRAPHDRAVRAGAGEGGQGSAHRFLRHLELRVRHPLLE